MSDHWLRIHFHRFLILTSITASLIAAAMLIGCSASSGPEGPVGPAGPAGSEGPPGPKGDAASSSQTYIGSDRCGSCHAEEYEKFSLSGHPYKLTKIENGQIPSFPYDEITGGVASPPAGYEWDDVSYVIGGYGWKARFIDNDGYIITGNEDSTTQFNYANDVVGTEEEWVAYHAGEEKPYDCGSCHTTGYSPIGHQDGLEGIIGTWAFPGIQCEECHGPGSLHAEDPQGVRMTLDRSSQLCGDCHIRGNPALIDASGGFVKHHEQYEEMFNSKHVSITCITCHDPHASSVFVDEQVNPSKGIRQQCETCHWQAEFQNNRLHLGVDCVDCHMPLMAKSAVANLEIFTGDIRSHIFSINPDPTAAQFTDDGALSSPFITLEYACKHCHNGEWAVDRDLDSLATVAKGYHTPMEPTPEPMPVQDPGDSGEALFVDNCSACHGDDGKGVENLGGDLTLSDFVSSIPDEQLLLFISEGIAADDPDNSSGVDMPPKGGNPDLTASDLANIVIYLRSIQE